MSAVPLTGRVGHTGRFARLLPLCALFLLLLAAPAPASAHANLVRAEPVAGTAVPIAPTEIRLFFTEETEVRYSEVAVYDTERRQYDRGDLRQIPGDKATLMIGVRDLPEGTYTVVWKANSAVDGHTTTGSFAFAVGNLPPPPPADPTVGATEFAPPTPAEVAVRWLMLLAATAFTGALGLRWLVWTPALRRAGLAETAPGGAFEARVGRRLTRLAGAALLLLAAATVAGLIVQAAKVTGSSVAGALDPARLGDFLFTTRAGAIWSVRLLLPAVAAMLLGPLFVGAFRAAGKGAAAPDGAPASPLAPTLFGVALGAAYLLTISLISHGAASPLWAGFSIAMDWLHLLGTAVWVGGLLGLALTAPLLRRLGDAAGARLVLLGVVSRFSTLALLSVAVLGVTGLYSAWLHVGSLDALLPTAYGRTLAVKLALFAGLLALGAFNFLWVRPRLAAAGELKRASAERVAGRIAGHFGRALRIEALLGVAILLAVALLTGLVPAREAIVQARAPQRVQTAEAGDLRITLALASLQPGENTFEVLLKNRRGNPVPDAQRVAIRLDMVDMEMGEAEAIAAPRGDGRYAVTGPFLSMSGDWATRVIVRRAGREDVDATYRFAIGSAANLAATANPPTPPQLPALTRFRALGLAFLAAGALLTALGVPLFRRGSGLGTALLMLVPTAVVVGGYLLYTDPGPALSRPPEPANPVAASAQSVARGQQLFAQNCVVCHGPQGRGDGPTAPTLNPRPPDMSLPHTAAHSDGYLFNQITNGVPGSAMPAWGEQFSAQDRWNLVNYLRAFNPLTANGAAPALPGTPAPASPVGAPAPATAPAMAGNGRLIYALDGKLWALDPAGGAPVNLLPDLPPDAYAAEPSLSPDGATLAYTLIVVPPVGRGPQSPQALPGSDLYLIDADGSNLRLLLEHDRPGVLITRPAWSPDGQALVFAYSAPIMGADGRYTGSIRELQRLDLASGERGALVKEAEDPALAPAGAPPALAYVLTDQRTFTQALWLAGPDGRDARKLVGAEPGFTAFAAPRFSPDGKRLLFAAVGGPGVGPPTAPTAPGGSLPGRAWRWLIAPFDPPSAAAHGAPWDLWTVALDGSDLRRITEVYEDSPVAAWSPDGGRIAFLSGGGVYVVGADGRGLTKVSPIGSHGPIAWAPR